MSTTNCVNPELQSSLNLSSKDKFILVLNLPLALRRLAANDPCLNIESLQMSVYGTIVPAIAIPPVEVRFQGQSTNYSSHSRPNYSPLVVNFVVDNQYKNYYVLWRWLDLLNDARESKYNGLPQTNREQTRLERIERGLTPEYQTNFSILALNEYNQTVTEFVYHNAFIINLGTINYNYREGEIIESTVEFQFSQLDLIRPTK
jgi:hypothetical protein